MSHYGKQTPAVMTPEVQDEIIDGIIGGLSLVDICSVEGMPHRRTVYRFLADEGEENKIFRKRYDRAVTLRTYSMAEEIIAIGDDNSRDWQERVDKDGNPMEPVVDHDAIQRSKLMCENRWKYLEKLVPHRYGKQALTDHDRPVGGYVIINNNFGTLPEEEIIPKRVPEMSVSRVIEHEDRGEDPDDI